MKMSYKYSRYDSEPPRYTIEGEITVIPDSAVFPVTISTKALTNIETIALARKVFEELQGGAQKTQEKFVLETKDYQEHMSSKSIAKVFGKKDKDCLVSDISLSLVLFFESDDFWTRAEKLSKIQDFLRDYVAKYKDNEDISVSVANASFVFSDKEKYREQLAEILYDRLMLMAGVIAKKENKTARVKEVWFQQTIQCDVINISKAVLSMKSHFEVAFGE